MLNLNPNSSWLSHGYSKFGCLDHQQIPGTIPRFGFEHRLGIAGSLRFPGEPSLWCWESGSADFSMERWDPKKMFEICWCDVFICSVCVCHFCSAIIEVIDCLHMIGFRC